MSFPHRLMAAALALPLAACVQPTAPRPDAAAANTAVPASGYRSVFEHYRAAGNEQTPPAQVWRAANDEVARLGGHAGHSKEDPPDTSAPAQPAPLAPARHGEHQ